MSVNPDSPTLLAQVADLQAQVQLMQSVLSHMTQGVMLLGKDGRINYFNARVCEICNVTAEFLASKPLIREMKDMQQQRGDFGPDLSGLPGPGRAAGHAVFGRIAGPGQKQHRRLVDIDVHLCGAGGDFAAADLHG